MSDNMDPIALRPQSIKGQPVRMYRCTECGKWSHAKAKPSKHKRGYLRDMVIDGDLGEIRDIAYVDCGPFEAWNAWRAAR